MMRSGFWGLVLLLVFLPVTGAATERSLYWQALEVDARLDADGRMHVSERHHMVFTGDWNGGERRFRLEDGQILDFHGMKRFDPLTGESRDMEEGVLTLVDNYGFREGPNLRWRSRRPVDPVFNQALIGYDLRYTLSNILVRQEDDGYLLNHDFAFGDRRWPIHSFVLRLEVDPVWQSDRKLAGVYRPGGLAPGQSYILERPLKYTGPGRPAGVASGISPFLGGVLCLAFLAAVGFFVTGFIRHEKACGRSRPLNRSCDIDVAWLEKNLFCHLPEVVAAAWDENINAQEVATVIARMAAEGKVEGEVRTGSDSMKGKPILHLRLLVEKASLSGYEADLAEALFFPDGTTDAERLQARYENFGFDPISQVREEICRQVERLAPTPVSAETPQWRKGFFLFLGALALSGLGLMLGPSGNGAFALIQGGYLAAIWLLGLLAALRCRGKVAVSGLSFIFLFGLVLLQVLGLPLRIFFSPPHIHPLTIAGHTLLVAAVVRNWLLVARYEGVPERLQLRRRLLVARGYFKNELAKPTPALADAWYPYLVAFGLDQEMNRWFNSFGAVSAVRDELIPKEFSSSSASFSRRQAGAELAWTGGGGAFGGAGASGTWAAAAVGLGGGVDIPATDDDDSVDSWSSGGRSSGGSSSGGGGGGGW